MSQLFSDSPDPPPTELKADSSLDQITLLESLWLVTGVRSKVTSFLTWEPVLFKWLAAEGSENCSLSLLISFLMSNSMALDLGLDLSRMGSWPLTRLLALSFLTLPCNPCRNWITSGDFSSTWGWKLNNVTMNTKVAGNHLKYTTNYCGTLIVNSTSKLYCNKHKMIAFLMRHYWLKFIGL